MFSHTSILVALLSWGTASFAFAGQDCYGPGDIDTNGSVTLDDFALLSACLAGPGADTPPDGCPPAVFWRADLDSDGDVDLADAGRFAERHLDDYFLYGPRRENLEAELLAMDAAGQLRAPDLEYERILRDLELIRIKHPELATVVDDMDYAPNQLIVGLLEGQPTDTYEAFNEYYLLVDEEVHSWWRVLTFCDHLNAYLLDLIYEALPEVDWAQPNYLIGTDDQIAVSILGTTYRYEIDDGFHDCFDGCDCHRFWTIDVDLAGTVTLVSYEEWGWSWCDFGSGGQSS
jgi:hypothetical protein